MRGGGVIDGFVEGVVKTMSNQYVILLIAILALAGLIVITVFIIKRVLATSLKVEKVYKEIVSGSAPQVTVAASKIPDLVNGSEFAYSFWLYVQSAPAVNRPRFVLGHPTVGGDKAFTAYLDKSTNTLTCQFGADSTQSASIQYLPMNRWVHVVVVYNNGTVTFFEDGEVHSVHGLTKSYDAGSGMLGISGGRDMGTDSPTSVGNYAPFKGYVGHVTVMNFQPSPGLVKRLYASGPTATSGWLSVFGIPGYGLRNPVYKLNKVSNSDEADPLL